MKTIEGSQTIGFVAFDLQFCILSWNKYLYVHTELDQAMMIGKNLKSLMDQENLDCMSSIFDNKTITGYEIKVTADPKCKKISLKGDFEPLFDENGHITGGAGFVKVIQAGEVNSLHLTDRQEKEQQIKSSEKKFRSLMEQSGDGIVITNGRAEVIDWNKAMTAITGYSSSEVLHLKIWDVQFLLASPGQRTEENYAWLKQKSREMYEGQNLKSLPQTYQNKIVTKSGETKYIEISTFVMLEEDDYWIGNILRDITREYQAKERLKEQQENLTTTLRSLGDGVITVNHRGMVTNMNPVAEKLTGYLLSQALDKHISEIFRLRNVITNLPVDIPLKDILDHREKINLPEDTELISKQGTTYNISDSAAPIIKEDGTVLGAILVFRDITQAYQQAAKLRELEERFRLAFQTSPDAVNINRLEDGSYIEINEGFTRITGYKAEDVIGKTSAEIKIWRDHTDRKTLVNQLKKEGFVNNLEAEFVMKDGTIITGLMSARVIHLNGVPHILNISRDISNRKKAELKLKANEERFRYILKHNPNPVAVFDNKMRYLMVSDRFMVDYGLQRTDIIGKSHFDVFPYISGQWKNIYQRTLKGEVMHKDLDRIKKPDGKYDYIKWQTRPWHEQSGVIGGVVFYSELITQRINAQNKLKERNDFIENIMDNLPVGISVLPFKSEKIDYCNKKFLEIIEFPADVINTRLSDLYQCLFPNQKYREELKERVRQDMRSSDFARMHWDNINIVTGEKKRKIVSLTNIPMNDQKELITVVQDITSKKEAEEERDRLYTYSLDMLAVAGFDGFFKQINPAWSRTLGWSVQDLINQPWINFVHKEEQKITRLAHAKLQAGESLSLFQHRFLCQDGSFKWLSWNAIPIPRQNLIFAVVRDISVNKLTEEELKIRNSELNNFVYKVSHDLRAPLSSVQGLINLIKMESEPAISDQYLKMVEERILKLDNFIRDILSHSKNLNTEINIEEIDFNQIVENCLNELNYLPNFDHIEKRISISEGKFYNDKVRIFEIFRNLISNSIKYLNPYVEINYLEIKLDIHMDKVDIVISDNGLGISLNHLNKIFDMFYKATDKAQSSGIGLYIVRQAIMKLGGEIKVDSKPNQGTAFYITLPNKMPS
ncbi:MAG: PAS domain-containing sensor histidine kinase [Candidatus Cyclobacteriaceae bacterium M3_2C_046]